jgi:hypothetical protein
LLSPSKLGLLSIAIAMIPQTPSTTVPPDSSAQNLLKLGAPFREFPRSSALDLHRHRGLDGSPVPFSEWLTRRLQVQDFDKLDTWDKDEFGIEKLIDLSTKKSKKDMLHLRDTLLHPH